MPKTDYRTRHIITRGLYIFAPFFTAVYNQERLILKTIYVVNNEILQKKSAVGACTACTYFFNEILTNRSLCRGSRVNGVFEIDLRC
jgi:hypothetical protein